MVDLLYSLATLMPEHPLAPDEVRLAAGWTQQTLQERDESRDMWYDYWEPVPGPPGIWRLHASGQYVRWVKEPSQ